MPYRKVPTGLFSKVSRNPAWVLTAAPSQTQKRKLYRHSFPLVFAFRESVEKSLCHLTTASNFPILLHHWITMETLKQLSINYSSEGRAQTGNSESEGGNSSTQRAEGGIRGHAGEGLQ